MGRPLLELSARWPALRQLGGDPLGLGKAARSNATSGLEPRTRTAERVVQSVCPYCAVGCGQLVYVQNREVSQIEGDSASPISRGRLCPKGAASKHLVSGPRREYRVKYRRPFGTEWEELSLDEAMEMIADRIVATRDETWESEAETEQGRVAVNRTLGIVSVENQARI
jgi:formate dehydrogenase major subunit